MESAQKHLKPWNLSVVLTSSNKDTEKIVLVVKKNLLIIGASGHGKIVADIALSMKKWDTISFLDDNTGKKNEMGIEVIGKTEDVSKFITDYDIFVAIGNNISREKLLCIVENLCGTIPSIIHPSSIISSFTDIGTGTVVMPGVVINCCTRIGKGCIINTGATIDHDNNLEDYVHVSPGANLAGTVKIGKGTWIGTGAAVINNISVVSGCIVGAGAVVVKDIIESGTYVGVPARKL